MTIERKDDPAFRVNGTLLDAKESVPAWFERTVANYPCHQAIGADLWQPTYDELNKAANALAETILGHGGTRGDHDCSSPSAKISLSAMLRCTEVSQ
jgi:acyl-CoA synthetase (AMP-forming)/AMP-acid ligase II